MALILSSANLKGGVGKTTLAINVASYLHSTGNKVLLVDIDPQGTATTWASVAARAGHDGPPVVAVKGETLRRDLKRLSQSFDLVVIDCPPHNGQATRAAVLASDLVMIPVVPGAEAIWALEETKQLVDDVRALRPELKAMVVMNRSDFTKLAQGTKDALEDSGLDLLQAKVGNRVAIGEAIASGLGVVQHQPSSVASKEIKALTNAMLQTVGG